MELQQVDFDYGRGPLLQDVTFRIDAGEMTGLLGANGAGKTTLVRLASGQLQCRRGTVRLDGDDVSRLTPRDRARRIAVVPQETRLTFGFDVEQVVAMGRAPHQGRLGLERPEDRRVIEESMELTGVADLRRRPFQQLSGGERQRVVIARALAQQASLLLLDEPTAFLDLRHRVETYELLRRLHRDDGPAILLVSHDLNMTARYCSRLLLLGEGRLLADGAPGEVLNRELIRQAYGVDNQVLQDPLYGHPYVVPLGGDDREPAS
ncbi:hypothetical protein ABI59_13070 [Acidobacteria bacterium Mor1]|nr:hypothetical protein ABI59_13070 [Acidobacteria bacterium Mor1]